MALLVVYRSVFLMLQVLLCFINTYWRAIKNNKNCILLISVCTTYRMWRVKAHEVIRTDRLSRLATKQCGQGWGMMWTVCTCRLLPYWTHTHTQQLYRIEPRFHRLAFAGYIKSCSTDEFEFDLNRCWQMWFLSSEWFLSFTAVWFTDWFVGWVVHSKGGEVPGTGIVPAAWVCGC